MSDSTWSNYLLCSVLDSLALCHWVDQTMILQLLCCTSIYCSFTKKVFQWSSNLIYSILYIFSTLLTEMIIIHWYYRCSITKWVTVWSLLTRIMTRYLSHFLLHNLLMFSIMEWYISLSSILMDTLCQNPQGLDISTLSNLVLLFPGTPSFVFGPESPRLSGL